ncbi:MAG: hypothetical protein PXX73_08010 [Sideroxydans sp.]|nr:hypothetical protein [Sideroxydans sp.]
MRHSFAASAHALPRHEATVELSVNQDNVIVRVNAAWDSFAHHNDGAALTNDAVLGLNLLDSISGKVSKHFTLTMLELARRGEREVVFDYRCDSPRVRRFMRAHLRSDSTGAVHYAHEHLYSETFPHLVTFKTATQRGRDTLMRCSICNHVRSDGLWRTPDREHGDTLTEVIYGVCPSCEQMLKEC